MAALQEISFLPHYGFNDDPLNRFYIPALKAAVRYDRSAGFFSSSALAVAAEGVAHLIANQGKMRLLVGAQLSGEDVAAIRNGYDLRNQIQICMTAAWQDPAEELMNRRLQALAWMVAQGMLEIRVVLPAGPDGLPLPASVSRDYYHTKNGILADASGDQVAFSGSINESATGWLHNYENFSVFRSWDTSNQFLEPIRSDFERLWAGGDSRWVTVEIPQAALQNLLHYCPPEPPLRDALEPELPDPREAWREQARFQFMRDAPYLLDVENLGEITAAVDPWPHQRRVAREVIRRSPERFLLCDEVGLGKTIEAGLILRQLLISGRVQRAVVLAPRSVLIQWQEELWEKFALRVPRYDGQHYWDLYGKPWPDAPSSGNPWDAFPVLLAGSQLAKRSDRREQLLASHGWDLVLVDEAHHARRKDFLQPVYRPNRLLSLLQELDEAGKYSGLVLMTATPMQINPVEVWDLLRLLGLGGSWGAEESNFLRYFQEIKQAGADWESADWDFVLDLLGDHLATGGSIDPAFSKEAMQRLGPAQWAILQNLPAEKGSRKNYLQNLRLAARPYLVEMVRRHTPLQHYMFRNTRSLLRQYVRQGLLQANVPLRRPEIVRIPMRDDEIALYHRIEEYISQFYQVYEAKRRGLGFIMTVYRRRLTSSFYAVRESLERRLKYLCGEAGLESVFTDEDLEQEDLSQDITDEVNADSLLLYKDEISYLENFLRELRQLALADSKIEQLKTDLANVFLSRSSVLIFTQYTDTMDYIRTQLQEVYGRKVACYSGRGGELWDGHEWQRVSKEAVKTAFRDGEVSILLGTESASEGLNLQTCGVLINYDMPWNPMRVEQRIGRIDRIGQQFREVWVRNYFYQDTIEDQIYNRLADRIQWFQVVVGSLQPILAAVEKITRDLAMLPIQNRQEQLEREIQNLQDRLDNRDASGFDLELLEEDSERALWQPAEPPVEWLADLKSLLLSNPVTASRLQPSSDIAGVYRLECQSGEALVTFSSAIFDAHPGKIQLLTFGNPLLEELLKEIDLPAIDEADALIRMQSDGTRKVIRWVGVHGDRQPKVIRNLQDLNGCLEADRMPAEPLLAQHVRQAFDAEVEKVLQHEQDVIRKRKFGEYLAEKARAQDLLVKAALVELAIGQQPDLVGQDGGYPIAYNTQAVRGLSRHGYPWAPLVKLVYEDDLCPRQDSEYARKLEGKNVVSLRGMFNELTGQAKKTIQRLVQLMQ